MLIFITIIYLCATLLKIQPELNAHPSPTYWLFFKKICTNNLAYIHSDVICCGLSPSNKKKSKNRSILVNSKDFTFAKTGANNLHMALESLRDAMLTCNQAMPSSIKRRAIARYASAIGPSPTAIGIPASPASRVSRSIGNDPRNGMLNLAASTATPP